MMIVKIYAMTFFKTQKLERKDLSGDRHTRKRVRKADDFKCYQKEHQSLDIKIMHSTSQAIYEFKANEQDDIQKCH